MDGAATRPLGDRNGPRAWLEYFLFRAAIGVIARLPRAAQGALVRVTVRLAMAIDSRRSAYAAGYIRQALGEKADQARVQQLVGAAWHHLVSAVVEDASYNRRVLGPSFAEHYQVELSDPVRRALATPGGGFMVTAHVGMWEAAPPMMAALGFQPLAVVSRPPRNRPLSRFFAETREARGYSLIPRAGAIEGVTAAIKSGGWVGLMLDQRAHGKTIIVPVFGRPAKCERTIPVLVKRLGRPVIFGACYRTDRPFHYRLIVDEVLWPDDLKALDNEAIAEAISKGMERMILRAPEQYLWLHDRYRGVDPPTRT
jgi:KDO2-lipid IV(A) lauroyltransferase